MRAAVYHGTRDIRVEEWPDPTPSAGELVLEVHAAGICGTDAHEYEVGPIQYPISRAHPVTGHIGPMIPGHEVSGRVVAVGADVSRFQVGEVVVSGGGISCGTCPRCVAGRTNLCLRYATIGLQRHGGLAEFCAVPAATCVSVAPYGLPEDTAALAQPMAIAHHSMRQGDPRPGERVLVIGAGGIGAFLSFGLVRENTEVLVVDKDAERLQVVKNLGVAQAVAVDAIDDLLAREGAPTLVYEVTGTRGGLDSALRFVEPGGRVVLVGLHNEPAPVDLRALTLNELKLIGTMAHVCAVDLPAALDLLSRREQSWVDIAPLALGLDRLIDDGIRPLVERRSAQIKTLIDPSVVGSRPTRHG
jgi:(R,R)-butanediol dehydrogenase/meso-butanediol dehydrogenase/diacetyl reductase